MVGEPPFRPSRPPRPAEIPDPDRPGLVLSGQTAAALDALAAAVAERLRAPDPPEPADLLVTTALGRPHRRHRLVAWGTTAAALAEALASGAGVVRGDAAGPGPLPFAFSGQGGPGQGLAGELYRRYRVFREVVDDCGQRYREQWGGDLVAAVVGDPGADPPQPDLLQPALFASQAALVETWAWLGVRPDLVVGHSVGEYAAWCVAGGMSVADGLDLTAQRGRLMQELTGPGAMLAARADRHVVEAVRAVVPGVELAVVNGDRDHVLAGEPGAVAEAARLLRRRDLAVTELPVQRAFHSSLLEPMLPGLRRAAAAVALTPTTVPLVSTLDGELRPSGTVADPDYFCAQTRHTARWDLALAALGRAGCRLFLEIGLTLMLAGYGRRGLPGSRWLPSRRRGGGGLSRTLAELHCAGVPVDWRPLAAGGGRVPLPAHPLHRRTYWIDPGGRR